MKRLRLSGLSVAGAVKNTTLVVLGTFLLAFGTGVFTVPFNLVAGGMSGIAIILASLSSAELLSVDFYVTVMTWVLFFAGLALLGKGFAMKTLISTVLYPPLLSLSMRLTDDRYFGGLLNLAESGYTDAALIVATVFSGVMIGTGVALSFLGGGSTGGIDVIALSISKKYKKIKSAHVLLFIDTLVILVGAFVIGDVVVSLLGIISAFISSVTIDRIFGGSSRAFIANIVSDKYEQINKAVIEEFGRTSTLIDCKGGYTGAERKLLTVSFGMSQYSALLAAILRIDKNAFITVHKAHEINGEGWTWELSDRERDENNDK